MAPPRIDTRPRHRKNSRPAVKSIPGYGKWLRGRPCACGGRNPHCGGKPVAAHVDYAAKGTVEAKGMSTKVGDRWQIPLSNLCHQLQHDQGWPWFDKEILGQAGAGEKMAALYFNEWLRTPMGTAWLRKQEATHA